MFFLPEFIILIFEFIFLGFMCHAQLYIIFCLVVICQFLARGVASQLGKSAKVELQDIDALKSARYQYLKLFETISHNRWQFSINIATRPVPSYVPSVLPACPDSKLTRCQYVKNK